MVIVNLIGGLGNQLFQYAAARSLADKHNTSLRIDLSWYATQTDRQYQLDEFCLKAKPARSWDYLRINPYLGLSRMVRGLVGNRWSRILGWLIDRSGQTSIYRPGSVGGDSRELADKGMACQRFFHFDPDFFGLPDNVYLSGFWQSYKYFDDVRQQVLQEIVLRRPLNSDCLALLEGISTVESVSIHVRRGDKVQNADYNATDIEYVANAVREIEKRVEQPVYFVFTDDLEWVTANLDIDSEVIFAGMRARMTDCEELVMMSHCKHNIIAESSFSWWGAWLNGNRDKIVISPSPQRWINLDDYRKHDLLPEEWLVVDGNEEENGIYGDDRKVCR